MKNPPTSPTPTPPSDPSDLRALAFCLLYAALTFGWYLVWKHFMAERSGDEAIFENCFWNAWHGNGLRSALEGWRPHLAVHFSPIVLLLLPLYGLFPSMHGVHLVVALAIAAAGYAFYRLSRLTLDTSSSTLLMSAFLLHPTIVLQTFTDFHEQALGVLPLVMMFLAYRQWQARWAALWGLLFVMAREDNALLVLALAVHAVFSRRLRMAATLGLLGVAWFASYRWFAIGTLGGGTLPGVFASTYSIWGSTPAEMVRAALMRPGRVVAHVLSGVPLRYLAQLFGPFLGVLPLGDAIVLVTVPQLLLILLASPDSRMFEIRTHFSIVPVVVLYVATLGTFARWQARERKGTRSFALARALPIALLAISLVAVPLWLVRAAHRLNPYLPEIRKVIAIIPDTASVTAPSYLLNEMARRPRLAFAWELAPLDTTTTYVVLEDRSRMLYEGITVERFYSPPEERRLSQAGYEKIYATNGWHVWRRR